MIRAEDLTARAARVRLAPLSFEIGAGTHAVLGAREEGMPLLLATLAGRLRPRSGSLLVLDQPPARVRSSIAYVPRDVVLPDALRVDEVLELAASIRREPSNYATHRLASLGVADLALRPVRTLTREETRTIAVVEAITSSARVLILEEPFVALDSRAVTLLASRLHERAEKGACVVVGTSSPRDARELADSHVLLDHGILVRVLSGTDSREAWSARGARLRLGVSDARPLLAELAREPAISAIESERASITVTGGDLVELARAVANAVLRTSVDLLWLRPDAPTLEQAQASRHRASTNTAPMLLGTIPPPATSPPGESAP